MHAGYPDDTLNHVARPPARSDYRIGIVGAGFVVRDVHLPAYRNAGFAVVAIASRTPEVAREVADLHGVPRVYETTEELLADPAIDIVDIAVPPHLQLGIVRQAVRHASHVKGILAHKPLAMNYAEACEIVSLCEDAGIKLAVNQNMRHDQSIRALKHLLGRGYLGEPLLASIEMRAVPHWQPWLKDYNRLTLLNISIHHLDCFRFLFGNPDGVFASVRPDPRTRFPHGDGICLYILEYESGLRASAWDDVWAGPAETGNAMRPYIKWRVEGSDGIAQGTLGWPEYPNRCPSTLDYASTRRPGYTLSPRWAEVWFPDAFEGTMGQLMDSLARGVEPEISGRDNLDTMALVDACYRSVQERRLVRVDEIKLPARQLGAPDGKGAS